MHATINDTDLYFDVDGAQLRVAPDGLDTAPTIVVLHGGPGFDQGYLRPGIGPLRDLAQLVFVDLRGQGRSAEVAVETCTLEQMAHDVVVFCDHVGLERPILLGHSAGGFVALHAAVRAPEAFAGLILCNTSATLAPEPDDGGDGLRAPSLEERAGAAVADVSARLFAGDFSPGTVEAFTRLVAPYYGGPTHMDVPGRLFPLSTLTTEVARRFFTEEAPSYDLRPRLREIAVPTLIVAGGHDWVCPPQASRTIADGIPRARLVTLDSTGHFSFSEQPDRFHEEISTYLRAQASQP